LRPEANFACRRDRPAPHLRRRSYSTSNAKAVWVYDLRANMTAFGNTRPLTVADFAEFEAAFGDDPLGHADRADQCSEGRFRRFSREDVAARNDNLDIAWLRDNSEVAEDARPNAARARAADTRGFP
jgi:type I restriction enzyme M protein